MSKDKDLLIGKQRELIAQIYGGALDPSRYQELLRTWDAHYEALGVFDARFHESDFTWADEWIDHFERAGEVFETLEQAKSPSLARKVQDSASICLLVDAAGRITCMSRSAAATFRCVANTPVADLNFDPPSHLLLEDMRRSLVERAHKPPQASNLVRYFIDQRPEPIILVAQVVNDAARNTPVILLRTANAAWHDEAGKAMQRSFNLTGAELTLVENLYQGKTIKEIAEKSGRSQATLRTQLSSVLSKIGAASQSGLARTLSGLIHAFNEDELSSQSQATPGSDGLTTGQSERVLELPNDIRIHLVESGDLSGDPFFFIQPTTWPTLTPEIVQALGDAGVRLISPYRSGLGQTTRKPLSFTVKDWAQTYVAALDALGIDRVQVGGLCSGGIYAYELAKALKDRATGVLAVDTGAPLKTARMINRMPLAPRRLFLASRYFPAVLTTPCKLATADFYSGEAGRARGVEYFVDGSPTDVDAVKNPKLWRIVRDNFDYVVRNPEGAANDVVIWSRDTSRLVSDVLAICPIRYLHGADNLIHRADQVALMASKHAACSARIVERESQCLIYRRPDVFASEILDLG